MELISKIIVFQEKEIRRVWHDDQWFFSVIDVVAVLTESKDPSDYWTTMKRREQQLPTICRKFKFTAIDGKLRATDCANTEGIFRIIQSVPSPNAEPFKLWLAKVGYERIQEIENPELGIARVREIYKAKGYSDDWIEMRLKSIDVRQQLTEEWQGRGVKEDIEYSILTAEISRATFRMTPSEYKNHKNLKRENLRDHMTNLELIFSMLGEEGARTESIAADAHGFHENKKAAIKGGTSAGDALQTFEKSMGRSVITDENYLKQISEAKKKRLKEGDNK